MIHCLWIIIYYLRGGKMMRSRKVVMACSGVMLGLAGGLPSAGAACPPLPAGVLCQAATALPEAADGISKFGDAIAHLTQLGDEAFKQVAVLIDHGRVQDLIESITQMNVNNDAVIFYLKEYQKYGGVPPTHSWDAVRSRVAETLRLATQVESKLRNFSSSLVDQHVYDELERAIGAKGEVLMSLSAMQAPPKDDPYLNDLLPGFETYAAAIVAAQGKVQDFSQRLAASR
jgi:hypothetical protein